MAFEQALLSKCAYSSPICQVEMVSILWGHCESKLELSGRHLALSGLLLCNQLYLKPLATHSPSFSRVLKHTVL